MQQIPKDIETLRQNGEITEEQYQEMLRIFAEEQRQLEEKQSRKQ